MIVPSSSFSKPWTDTQERQHSKSDNNDKLHNAKKLNSAGAFCSAENYHIILFILLLVAGLCPASQVDS